MRKEVYHFELSEHGAIRLIAMLREDGVPEEEIEKLFDGYRSPSLAERRAAERLGKIRIIRM